VSQFSEGRGWIKLALALPDAEARGTGRAKLLSGAARLAFYAGAIDEASTFAEASESLFRAAGDPRGLGSALFHRALANLLARRLEEALARFKEASDSFREAGDEWGMALAAGYHGTALTFKPECEDEARALLNEARSRSQALGDDWLTTVSSHYLATIALRHGDYATARTLNEEMLACAQNLGDTYRISRSLHQLAEIALAQQRADEALSHLQASMAMSHEQRRTGDLAQQLRFLAQIKAAQSRPEEAVRCYALATRFEGHASTMPPDDASVHERLRETLRAAMGPQRYDAEWASGASMSLEQTIASAGSSPRP
jgi:tetratricopeptide (TPR) repeat protein